MIRRNWPPKLRLRGRPSVIGAWASVAWGWVCVTAWLGVVFAPAEESSALKLEDRLAPPEPELHAMLSPDWAEPAPPPPPDKDGTPAPAAFGALAPAARQPQGALSGRVVFMNGGHGWTYDPNFSPPWRLLRGTGWEMNEDYGNVDQLNLFALYCFNAGAVVVPFRPLGQQTNEVVLDNDDPGVAFVGAWANSTSPIFHGAAGDVPYRYAALAASETATATYTPAIPRAGFYPVYAWARHGSDRGDQLYRVRHTGGESQVRLPHHRVGNGWVWLGEYHFNAGSNPAAGSVVISNLRGSTNGSVVIADAIRFGNGMGSADNGGGGSRYPREDESARYWIRNSLGVGQAASLYDGTGNDEQDSWSAPPKMTAEMNREAAGDLYDRIHISFHSNAGGGRGSIGLITSDPTPHQAALAQLAGKEVNDDLVALGSPPLEVAWNNRSTFTYTGGYSEITGSLFNYEMAATIIEVAFHDNESDAKLLRDSKARAAVGKAALHAVVKYFNQYATNPAAPLAFLPEAPTNLRALAANTNGHVTLGWLAPLSLGDSQNPTNYVLYRSTNGLGFGQPMLTGNVLAFTVTNLPPDTDFYFRVAAVNAGGESMPSEVAGCRASSTAGAPRVLVVNAFDRFDRVTNPRQDTVRQSYTPPGPSGTIERVWPRRVNAFDYVVAHGQALAAHGRAFDSCQNEAVANAQVPLAGYAVVLWACGNESVDNETFSSLEQARLSAYLAAGGAVFASGADVAYDLDRPSGPTSGDRAFLRTQLHAAFSADSAGAWTVAPASGSIFAGRAPVVFDDGSRGIYRVPSPDVLSPFGSGAAAALNYVSGTGGAAAIQYDGSAGGGRVVLFAFAFETITDAARRNQYLGDILAFLSPSATTNVPPSILTPPADLAAVVGSSPTLSVVAAGSAPLGYQWRFSGADLPGATASSFTRAGAQFNHSGHYRVVVSNAVAVVTSAVALLTVTLPPAWETLFADDFEADLEENWVVNRSSADSRVTFNYNYAADGIAAAPNSTGGTTRGVKFEANLSAGAPAALNISPRNGGFPGDHRLRFDLWLNANGPFPLGGAGSTEHFTAGLGASGSRVQWTNTATADGFWFAVDGEGQATDAPGAALADFEAFSGTTRHAPDSGVFAAGTAGNARGNTHPYYATTFPGGQTAPAAQQAAHPQQTGALAVGTVGLAWREVVISRTGGAVEWSMDGLRIATLVGATFTASNVFLGYWDSFASLSDNPALSFALVDNVRVERLVTKAPPFLTAPPQSRTVTQGQPVVFSVAAGGTAPLAYQWRFHGTNLPGGTASGLVLPAARLADAGPYSVAVTNAVGSVTSADALLAVMPLPPPRFEAIARLPDGRVQLTLSGEPGRYAVEHSPDLGGWNLLTTVTLETPTLVLVDDTATNAARRYYRAVSAP